MITDTELWRLHGVSMDVRCILRKLRMSVGQWDDWIRFELRIEQAGEVIHREQFKDRAALKQRSQQLRATLEAKGWAPIG